MKRRIALLFVTVVSTVALVAPEASAFTKGFPDSMAAIGDSITQAANVDGDNFGASHPEHSWSTGYDAGDSVISHYERLLKKNRKISGRNFNDAVSGADMADAPAQADRAVSQGVEYVTIEMGGNDVCKSSKEAMTSVASYETNFRLTMQKLTTGLPNAKIFVASVPDVYQLYNPFKNDWWANWIWNTFDVCQAMLNDSYTEADRQFVRQRNIEFNQVLQRVCAEFTQCLYDNGAVFNYQFTRSDVSSVDYFHPSMTGQKNIAQGTWLAGYWPTA